MPEASALVKAYFMLRTANPVNLRGRNYLKRKSSNPGNWRLCALRWGAIQLLMENLEKLKISIKQRIGLYKSLRKLMLVPNTATLISRYFKNNKDKAFL